MPKQDREARGYAEALDKLANPDELDATLEAEGRENLGRYLVELDALPYDATLAEHKALERKYAGLPMASVDTLLREMAEAEDAHEAEHEAAEAALRERGGLAGKPLPILENNTAVLRQATGVQPARDRVATGRQGAGRAPVEDGEPLWASVARSHELKMPVGKIPDREQADDKTGPLWLPGACVRLVPDPPRVPDPAEAAEIAVWRQRREDARAEALAFRRLLAGSEATRTEDDDDGDR
jgi:hypothetical protein